MAQLKRDDRVIVEPIDIDSTPIIGGFTPDTPRVIDSRPKTSDVIQRFISPDDDSPNVGSGSGDGSSVIGSGSGGNTDGSVPLGNEPSGTQPVSNNSLWQPDPNLTPEENLQSLTDYLYRIFHFSLSDGYDFTTQPRVFADLLNSNYQILLRYFRDGTLLGDFDKATLFTLAEKITDIYQHYIDSVFTQAMSYQSWYLQQDYNSPVNQLNRLTEAGLSSAFITSGLNSGNAASPASVVAPDQVQPSGAGQVQSQMDASRKSLFGSIFGTIFGGIGDLLSAGGGFFKDVAEGKTINQLRPYEIADLGARIASSHSALYKQQTEVDQIKQNMAFKYMDNQISYGQQQLESAGQSADRAYQDYQTNWQNFTEEYTEQQWHTVVRDKKGNTRDYTLTTDELRDAINNDGRTKDGYIIEGAKSWKNITNLSAEVNAKASVPFVGSSYVTGGLSNSTQFAGENKTSDSSESQRGWSTSHANNKSAVHYNDKGTELYIGDSKFTSVMTRKRLPLPEYKDMLQRKLKNYQDALDNFNRLSSGQQVRCLRMLEELTEGLSKFDAGVLKASYSDRIKQLFAPRTLQGD